MAGIGRLLGDVWAGLRSGLGGGGRRVPMWRRGAPRGFHGLGCVWGGVGSGWLGLGGLVVGRVGSVEWCRVVVCCGVWWGVLEMLGRVGSGVWVNGSVGG